MDLIKMFFEGVEKSFSIEIIGRTFFMFILILIVLRLSGRRGVRQLTLFEVAIILGMGSAAGDPMFQEDLPLFYGAIVLFSVIVLYKIITFASSKSKFFSKILEGEVMVIVEAGQFNIDENRKSDFSQNEFFGELRNQSIEHLGQVKIALLEVDGSLSILKFDHDHVKYGLPLFPNLYKEVKVDKIAGPYACMFCGNIVEKIDHTPYSCARCHSEKWSIAINNKYVG
ncbi:MAG TPA: YetF domain-containing protein [Chitinophagales bacterium]|nr:YetF domain-containing protein [Chitinophagales bacterium]